MDKWKNTWLPIFTLLCGVGFSIFSYVIAAQKQADLQEARFITSSETAVARLRANLIGNAVSLNALRTFYETAENVNRAKFEKFAEALLNDHPSLMVYGWLPRIRQYDRLKFESRLSEDYATPVKIRDGDGAGVFTISPQKSDYFPVSFGVPNVIATRRLGVDVASLPQGGPAIKAAIESGMLTASGPVPYTEEFGYNSNVMLFNAVFKNDETDASLADGDRDVSGIVMALFKIGSLIEKQFNTNEDLTLFIEDMTDLSDTKIIYGEAPTSYKSRLEKQFSFAGRDWKVTSTSLHANDPFQWLPLAVLIIGLLFSGIVSLALLSLIRRKQLVENLVKERTVELNQTILKLEESNGDLERYAYIASHDLKSPLRAIDNLTLWLEEDIYAKIDDVNKERLKIIRGRIARMEGLLNSILSYSRAGKTPEDRSTIAAEDLLNQIFDLQNIPSDFKISLSPSLKNITVQRMPLEQIFHNLVSNAIKHNASPGGTLSIEGFDDETTFRFIFSDNGPGIDPAYHGKIFEMFQTLHSRDVVEGSGMGLALVKRMTQRQKGKIEVQSELGEGTQFILTWPKTALD